MRRRCYVKGCINAGILTGVSAFARLCNLLPEMQPRNAEAVRMRHLPGTFSSDAVNFLVICVS